MRHSTHDLPGKIHQVELIGPLDHHLDQPAIHSFNDRFGDADHIHIAFLPEDGLVIGGLILIAGETGKFPEQNGIIGVAFVLARSDHLLKCRPLLRGLAGDAVLLHIDMGEKHIMSLCVFLDQAKLTIRGKLLLLASRDANIGAYFF